GGGAAGFERRRPPAHVEVEARDAAGRDGDDEADLVVARGAVAPGAHQPRPERVAHQEARADADEGQHDAAPALGPAVAAGAARVAVPGRDEQAPELDHAPDDQPDGQRVPQLRPVAVPGPDAGGKHRDHAAKSHHLQKVPGGAEPVDSHGGGALSVLSRKSLRMKSRLRAQGGVANPRDSYGYPCALRLALNAN